jgi:hypothetical protein
MNEAYRVVCTHVARSVMTIVPVATWGLLALVVASALGAVGCKTLTAAAARDPMKCERDPNCQKKRGRSMDCDAQCVDDYACIERCKSVQQQTGGSVR